MDEEKIGTITHYFGKIGVGVVKLENGDLQVGDRIKIRGKDGAEKVEQEVNSMQVKHKPVQAAGEGDEVGLKVEGVAREGDVVFKVVE